MPFRKVFRTGFCRRMKDSIRDSIKDTKAFMSASCSSIKRRLVVRLAATSPPSPPPSARAILVVALVFLVVSPVISCRQADGGLMDGPSHHCHSCYQPCFCVCVCTHARIHADCLHRWCLWLHVVCWHQRKVYVCVRVDVRVRACVYHQRHGCESWPEVPPPALSPAPLLCLLRPSIHPIHTTTRIAATGQQQPPSPDPSLLARRNGCLHSRAHTHTRTVTHTHTHTHNHTNTHTHTHIHSHTYAQMHTRTRTRKRQKHAHAHAHAHIHAHTHAHVHARTQIHAYAHTHALAHAHTFAHVHRHTPTPTHIHTRTHANTPGEKDSEKNSHAAAVCDRRIGRRGGQMKSVRHHTLTLRTTVSNTHTTHHSVTHSQYAPQGHTLTLRTIQLCDSFE